MEFFPPFFHSHFFQHIGACLLDWSPFNHNVLVPRMMRMKFTLCDITNWKNGGLTQCQWLNSRNIMLSRDYRHYFFTCSLTCFHYPFCHCVSMEHLKFDHHQYLLVQLQKFSVSFLHDTLVDACLIKAMTLNLIPV